MSCPSFSSPKNLQNKKKKIAHNLCKQLSYEHLGQSIYEKEMLAILHAVDLWRPYFFGQPFQIKTDH
jgi:hypothetical protein